MGNLEIYEKVRTVPQEAQKRINGGRIKGMTDINPMWRIKVLTELFGPCGIGWYYKPVRKWTETVGSETAAFVDIELYIKQDGEWSMPISGTGGNMFAAKEKNGIFVSDECYKMATTDAISVACKQLGIGADVYWSTDRTKYDEQEKSEQTQVPKQQTSPKLVTEPMIKALCMEMDRVGMSMESMLKWAKIKSLTEMRMDWYLYAMQELKKRESVPKEKAPDQVPDIPENQEGLPFA